MTETPSIKNIYPKLFLFRLINGLVLRTYFAPDEYWQAPEIAHSDAFGYGYRTWEWDEENPIRSPLYHLPFALFFKLFKVSGLDNPTLIAYFPRVLQAVYSSLFDFVVILIFKNFIKSENKEIKSKKVIIMLILICTNWFSLFAMPRNIINSFEACLFAIGFYFWENYQEYLKTGDLNNKQSKNNNLYCRVFVGINFISRPTSIIPWVLIWPYELFQRRNEKIINLIKIIIHNILTLVLICLSSVIIDVIYFKKLTWSALNFFKFNLLQAGAELYGVHDRTWYFTQGIPYLLMGFVLYFVYGVYCYFKGEQQGIEYQQLSTSTDNNTNDDKYQKKQNRQNLRLILYLLFPILFMSLSKHKEDRFLLPLFPLFYCFIGLGMLKLRKNKILLGLAIISNLALFVFMGFIHQQGSLPLMDKIRNIYSGEILVREGDLQQEKERLIFFTECHQTPFHSFVHAQQLEMEFPDCSPESRRKGSESKKLFENPLSYMKKALEGQNTPRRIVLYSNFLENKEIKRYLEEEMKYSEIYRTFHAYFAETPIGNINDVYYVIMETNLQ